MNDQSPPSRGLSHLHLSTLIASTLFIGVLFWANFRERTVVWVDPDDVRIRLTQLVRGWPLEVSFKTVQVEFCDFGTNVWVPQQLPVDGIAQLGTNELFKYIDVLLATLLAIAFLVLFEWLSRSLDGSRGDAM